MINREIWVLDDDEDDQIIFASALHETQKNINITVFYDSNLFLKTIQNTDGPAPDLLFLDSNLNSASGLTCLKALKANKLFHNTRVAVMSTFLPTYLISEFMNHGAHHFFEKPSDYNTLVQQVKLLLHQP